MVLHLFHLELDWAVQLQQTHTCNWYAPPEIRLKSSKLPDFKVTLPQTETGTCTDTVKMCLEPNENLQRSLSLSSMNTSHNSVQAIFYLILELSLVETNSEFNFTQTFAIMTKVITLFSNLRLCMWFMYLLQ